MKKKEEKIELTIDDKIKREKAYLRLQYIHTPTRYFVVGEDVSVGNLEDAKILEVLENGKGYIVKSKGDNITAHSWMNLFKKNQIIEKNLLREQESVYTSVSNYSIESLFNKYFFFGIDCNPEYQRDYVWTHEDKVSLIDSVFRNIEIGKFCLWDNRKNQNFSYEIVDGKQRLLTLIDFYEDRFPYKGKMFSELHGFDKHHFLDYNIPVITIKDGSEKDVMAFFLKLNTCGKVMDQNTLQKVQTLLSKMEG